MERKYGDYLKLALEINDMSSNDLAKKLNVTKQTISGYVNSNHLMDLDKLVKIADLLNCSTDFLVGNTTDYHSSRENLVIEYYRGLNNEQKNAIFQLLKSMNTK